MKCYIRIRPLNVDELEREDETAVEVSDDGKEVRSYFCRWWELREEGLALRLTSGGISKVYS